MLERFRAEILGDDAVGQECHLKACGALSCLRAVNELYPRSSTVVSRMPPEARTREEVEQRRQDRHVQILAAATRTVLERRTPARSSKNWKPACGPKIHQEFTGVDGCLC